MPKKRYFGPPKRIRRNIPSIPSRAVYVETDQHESFHAIAERLRINPRVVLDEDKCDADSEESEQDDEAFRIAVADHPDLEILISENRLPEEFMDPGQVVWSPMLHLSMHAVVERQLVMPDMTDLLEIACRLETEGKLTPHELVHVFAAAITDQIADMNSGEDADEFDVDRYVDEIPVKYQEWLVALGL